MKISRFFAAFFISIATTFSSAAYANDWGCEVLLCLSNPAGPMAVSQCVPPIQRLYAAIFKSRPDPFPTCATATSSNGSRSYANVEYNNYYDQCPSGTIALSSGSTAVQGTVAQVQAHNRGQSIFSNYSVGIGESAVSSGEGSSLPRKVCVGNDLGNVNVMMGSNSDGQYTIQVGVYDRVAFIDPAVNGFAIKVYMNDALYRVVRPKF